MNYVLNDIRTILINNSYSNVYVNSLPEIEERICIFADGGSRVETTQAVLRQDYTIYIKSKKPSTTRLRSQNIFKLLNSYQGKLTGSDTVTIYRISTIQPPIYWKYDEQTKTSEFAIKQSVLYLDIDLTEF